MILKSKETKETRIFLGEEERRKRRRRRKKGPIESRVHELKMCKNIFQTCNKKVQKIKTFWGIYFPIIPYTNPVDDQNG